MVGAIADWFAVTALFRHPLRLPIPHTALIPRRKDEFGKSLEEFFSENFLHEQVIRERLATADIARRVGAWVSEPANADRVVAEAASVLAIGLRKMRDADVASLVEEVLIPRFMAEPISPVAGGLLQEIVADNAHHGLVDLALEEAHRWLVHNQETFSDVVGERAPWWAPDRLNELVTARLHLEAVRWVADIRRDPQHHARHGAGQPAAPARAGPAQQPGHAGARGASQAARPGAAADRRHRPVPVERVPQGAARGARGRDGPAARPGLARAGGLRRADRPRRRAPGAAGRLGRRLRGLGGRALRRRAHRGHHAHDRALGRRGGGPQDRAARRPRPAVHPDQRHHRRRPRGCVHPRGLAGASRRA